MRRRSHVSKSLFVLIASIAVLVTPLESFAKSKKYDPGVSDYEIKLGQTMPHSGPLSALSAVGKAEVAYFEMLNASGGVNGRKIKLISLDGRLQPRQNRRANTRARGKRPCPRAIFIPGWCD